MEPSKAAAIRAAKESLNATLGSRRKVTGGVRITTESKRVGSQVYWYATAECNWKDR